MRKKISSRTLIEEGLEEYYNQEDPLVVRKSDLSHLSEGWLDLLTPVAVDGYQPPSYMSEAFVVDEYFYTVQSIVEELYAEFANRPELYLLGLTGSRWCDTHTPQCLYQLKEYTRENPGQFCPLVEEILGRHVSDDHIAGVSGFLGYLNTRKLKVDIPTVFRYYKVFGTHLDYLRYEDLFSLVVNERLEQEIATEPFGKSVAISFLYHKGAFYSEDSSHMTTPRNEQASVEEILDEYDNMSRLEYFDKYYLINQSFFTADQLWSVVHHPVPKPPYVVCNDYQLIRGLKKNLKFFLRTMRTFTSSDDHLVRAVANLTVVLGEKANQYVQDRTEALLGPDPFRNKEGCYSDIAINWHDRGINLKFGADPDCLWKFRKAPVTDGVDHLPRVALNWEQLKQEAKSYKEAVEILNGAVYDQANNKNLASECGRHNVSQWMFEHIQERVAKRDLSHESIPAVSATKGDYCMSRLDKDDYRGLFLGNYTNCCQHIEGAGRTCAWHGFESPEGGFYIVTKKGKIVAQSWAWRDGADLCFDNVEALNEGYMPTLAELYQEVSNKLLGRLGISRVLVGSGYDDLGVSKYWPSASERAMPPAGCYTDASNQHVIASL